MFTKFPITASLVGLLGHRPLSTEENSVEESFRQGEFTAYAAQEDEPVRLPRAEDLNQILNFALGMSIATDFTR